MADDELTSPTFQSHLNNVWKALEEVADPEIPVISVVQLGMITDVSLEGGTVTVKMTPTFAGCPALEFLRDEIRKAVIAAGFDDVRVETVFDPPWSTDRITSEGRRRLKKFGLAPPASRAGSGFTSEAFKHVACPFCDSTNTALESIFGPTLCRSIHYCNACRQSFEHFKPV